MPLNVLPSITKRSGSSSSRAPRWMLERVPRRRPEPHSTASTTRSRVWTGLTFTQAAPRRPAAYGASAALTTTPSCPSDRTWSANARAASGSVPRHRGTRCSSGTSASSAAQRSVAGRSSRSRPSRCSTSKKYGVTAVMPSALDAVRAAVSWNGRGRPAASSASASPSSTSSSAAKDRTTSTTSGSRWVMSSRLRVAIEHLVAAAVHLDPDAVELGVDRQGAVHLGQRRVQVGCRRRQHRLDRTSHGQADRGQRVRSGEGRVDDVRRASGEHRRSSYVGDRRSRGLRDALGHHRLQRALTHVAERHRPQPLLLVRGRAAEQVGDRLRPRGHGSGPAQRRRDARTQRRPRRRRATAASAGGGSVCRPRQPRPVRRCRSRPLT